MSVPQIEVLGVYRIAVTDELVQEQADVLYGENLPPDKQAETLARCREQLESVALIEALVSNLDKRFRVDDFTQVNASLPRESWQAAWAEAYLSADGSKLLARGDEPEALPAVFRIAFVLHCWQPTAPLVTSYGDVHCPAPGAMLDRLHRLVPYETVD